MKPNLILVPKDVIALNEAQWIKYMTQERGYLVLKKSEVLGKLTA